MFRGVTAQRLKSALEPGRQHRLDRYVSITAQAGLRAIRLPRPA
jgi:hypothetical protein